MIRLIIFDWDDVLTLGSKEGYFRCYHETLNRLGINLDPKEEQSRIMKNWGKHHREELRGLLQEHPRLLDKACEIYETGLFGDTFIDSLHIIPGTVELVQRLSGKYILCVATGQNPEILRHKVMPKFGFPDVFSQVISSYDIGDTSRQKPHPHMVEQILKTQKVRPDEAILVGDARGDVAMALNAGVTPVAVLTGHMTRKDAQELEVQYIIQDITHLETVLEKLD